MPEPLCVWICGNNVEQIMCSGTTEEMRLNSGVIVMFTYFSIQLQSGHFF